MSRNDAPLAKVVDLRRWREERDRRHRAENEEVELVSTRAPDRISWPFRLLALFTGLGFADGAVLPSDEPGLGVEPLEAWV